jgi:hypothetical protein
MSGDKDINFYGKISKFPNNTNSKNAYNFLQNINISKKKLWYFLIEKDVITKDNGTTKEVQIIKYNNKKGVNCNDFLIALKEHYSKDQRIKPLVEQLNVAGKKEFSTISNIPDVEIDGKKFITIITQDLIKLLK